MQRSVLLGEFDFTLDVKNRVAIPARLRAVFAGGVYLTRGFDRCLAAFPPEEWDRFVADQTGDLPAMSEKGREVRRFLFAAATFDELDRQGRITVPANLLGFAGSRRTSPSSACTTTSRSGTARRGRSTASRWRRGPMLPQTNFRISEYEMALAHTPVLLDELVDLLKPAAGEIAFDATFGAGGQAAAVARCLGPTAC